MAKRYNLEIGRFVAWVNNAPTGTMPSDMVAQLVDDYLYQLKDWRDGTPISIRDLQAVRRELRQQLQLN